ncbi:MAG: hypothetical protein K0R94_797 [Burkholderiales bacterium]|jgi:hypothetical protein|nr:hypothetical protein [Burkholderiales bacterium]
MKNLIKVSIILNLFTNVALAVETISCPNVIPSQTISQYNGDIKNIENEKLVAYVDQEEAANLLLYKSKGNLWDIRPQGNFNLELAELEKFNQALNWKNDDNYMIETEEQPVCVAKDGTRMVLDTDKVYKCTSGEYGICKTNSFTLTD